MTRAPPPAVEVPPETDLYAAFGHRLKLVVLRGGKTGPDVKIRVFCVVCGRSVEDGTWLPVCEPEIPPLVKS